MQVWGDIAKVDGLKKGGTGRFHEGVWFFLRHVWQQEGFRGYFRGLGATLGTVPLSWGIYFPLYDDFKRSLSGTDMSPAYIHCSSAIA